MRTTVSDAWGTNTARIWPPSQIGRDLGYMLFDAGTGDNDPHEGEKR